MQGVYLREENLHSTICYLWANINSFLTAQCLPNNFYNLSIYRGVCLRLRTTALVHSKLTFILKKNVQDQLFYSHGTYILNIDECSFRLIFTWLVETFWLSITHKIFKHLSLNYLFCFTLIVRYVLFILSTMQSTRFTL